MILNKTIVASLVGLFCAACTDGTSNNVEQETSEPSVYRGRLVSPIVAGMRYESGTQFGVTDSDGYFTYQLGRPIQFTAAGVNLPTIIVRSTAPTPQTAQAGMSTNSIQISTITSHELARSPLLITPTSISSDPGVVLNAVRLLLMLDSDGDAGNGVTISADLQATPQSDLNLATPDLESAAAQLQIAASAANPAAAHSWPTEDEASAYLRARRACALTGVYRGRASSTSVSANITALSFPTLGDVFGFIKTRYGDPHSNGMFHFSLSPDADSVGNTIGAEILSTLHYQGQEWPFAEVIPTAPPLTLHFDWLDTGMQGGWELEGSFGTFDAYLVANTDTTDGSEFAAIHRFVRFPTKWIHARGYPMYYALIVEIDRRGNVSARLVDPLPGAPDAGAFVTMTGSVSGYSGVEAIARNSINGEVEWRFEASVDRSTMTLRTPRLYQSASGGLADDFGGDSIAGCSL